MAGGPGVPLEGYFAAGLDGHGGAVAFAEFVADDVDAGEAVGGYEAVVEVVGLPAYGCGDGGLVFERGVPALVCDAVGDDFVDVAVGCDEGGEEEDEI